MQVTLTIPNQPASEVTSKFDYWMFDKFDYWMFDKFDYWMFDKFDYWMFVHYVFEHHIAYKHPIVKLRILKQ